MSDETAHPRPEHPLADGGREITTTTTKQAMVGTTETTTIGGGDREVWLKIGRLEAIQEGQGAKLTEVVGDVGMLKQEGARHTVQLEEIVDSLAPIPAIHALMRRIEGAVQTLQAHPQLSPAAATYAETQAQEWPPERVKERDQLMEEWRTFRDEQRRKDAALAAALLKKERDLAAALAARQADDEHRAETSRQLLTAIFIGMIGVLGSVLLSFFVQSNGTIRVALAVVLVAGMAIVSKFILRLRVRVRAGKAARERHDETERGDPP